MDRPDIALVVKASFNNTSRRITFPSAAKCRLNALFARITESFSLGASSFHIAYTDEDGEDFDIVSEADLTEAVSYFSSGIDADDYGTSLGAPTLYSADWNNPAHDQTSLPVFQPSSRNKIILRVHVVVEYDGPSLSDTASIMESISESSAGTWAQEEASSENAYTDETSDYSAIESQNNVHGGRQREFRTSSTNLHQLSRTNGSSAEQFMRSQGIHQDSRPLSTGSFRRDQDSRSFQSTEPDMYRSDMGFSDTGRPHVHSSVESNLRRRTSSRLEDVRVDNALRRMSLNSRPDSYRPNGQQDWNSRPTSHQVSLTSLHGPRNSDLSLNKSLSSSTLSMSAPGRDSGAPASSLTSSELGARWIREQTERVRRKLGPISSSGGSSRSSMASGEGSDDDDQTSIYSEGRGNLELVRETNGKWYYSYSSADMPGQASTRDNPFSERRSMASLVDSAYADNASRPDGQDITSLRLSMTSINTDPFHVRREDYASSEVSPIETESLQTPPEVADEFEEPFGPPGLAPDCSACGIRLEYMRYVCTVCGEGHFWLESDEARQSVRLVAGGDRDSGEDSSSSASSGDQTTWAPPRRSSNVISDLGESSRQAPASDIGRRVSVELTKTSSSSEAPLLRKHARNGYELCPACIELRGIQHTKAMGEIEMNRQKTSGPMQNIRKFGALNHTYKELLWGAKGWKEIEYNDKCKCSICQIELYQNRFKCISCPAFDLCRTCHQNAQEIHPAHSFLAVPDQKQVARQPTASPSQVHPSSMRSQVQYPGMHAVKHAGVFCHNCMQDIVGPRFHCAVCPNWDVCVQCEPVTSAQTGTGSHTSDHIMMKIPLPLASSEVQQVSRRAREQWAQRDSTVILAAGDILDEGLGDRPVSPTNETAYGGPTFRRSPLDHGARCRACSRSIIGRRYQCANCPSEPEPYNLCSACERTSYTTHDSMHVFVKFDRPAHFPLQSTLPILPVLYKTPVGQVRSTMPLDPRDPTAYLRCVEHRSTICDVHVGPIQGVWLRCVHCEGSFDVCLACAGASDHDPTHIFAVFKSEVDMPKFRALAALSSEHSRPLILQRCYVT